jgi:uncharacterized protein involved in exopolysaccharide biosynthesis
MSTRQQQYQQPSPAQQAQELTVRDILNVLFRHKKKIIAFFICTVVLVSVATLLMKKTYESTAQVLIRLGRENTTLDPTVTIGTALNISESRENEINSEMEVIKSREIAEKVVKAIGIDRILNRKPEKTSNKLLTTLDSLTLRESAVLAITKNLTAEVVKKTNVINITFDSHDPKTAQDVITYLIGFYQEKHMAIFRPSGSYGFFEKQTDTLNEQLNDREDSLRSLKNSTGIASIEPQRTDLLSRISALQLESEQVNADLVASGAKIRNLQKSLEDLPRIINEQKMAGTAQSSSELLRTQLNELKVKKQELGTKYSDSSRTVTDIQRQIDETSTLLNKEEFNNSRSTAAREIQMNLLAEQSNFSGLSAKARSIHLVLESARGELTKFNNNAVGISRLERQQDLGENNYRKYTENLEQSRIDGALKAGNMSNIAIIQAATFPIKPLKPRKLYNLALGILLGLFGGLSLAFIAEFLDHTLKSREDVETQLHLPVLGAVSFFNGKNGKVTDATSVSHAETFEAIRGALHSTQDKMELPRVIGITSCYSGEGVSTTAANVSKALAFRHDQGKVLLVDLNLDDPFQHSHFGVPLSPGFTDLVEPQSPAPTNQSVSRALCKDASGIDVLPAGRKSQNPLQLGRSERFTQIIAAGKKDYATMIFDLPSLAQSSMAIELAKYFDGIILVVESERVRRQVAQQAIAKMSRAGIAILGVVINKRKFYVPHWAYKRL